MKNKDNTNAKISSSPSILSAKYTILTTLLLSVGSTLLYTVPYNLSTEDNRDGVTKVSLLSSEWLLDDKVSILSNPLVVESSNPIYNIWLYDFWGKDLLIDPSSHKSWRPLTTLFYRWNYQWVLSHSTTERNKKGLMKGKDDMAYSFHYVDRILHGIVTALIVPVTLKTFLLLNLCPPQDMTLRTNKFLVTTIALITAALYGTHPIHVESVANSTGRAEVLCAIFYLLGFWVYASTAVPSADTDDKNVDDQEGAGPKTSRRTGGFVGAITAITGMLFTGAFTLASMLCKEHGITLPIMCIIWDWFIGTNTTLFEIYRHCIDSNHHRPTRSNMAGESTKRKRQCQLFLLRTIICFVVTIILVLWRLAQSSDSLSSKPTFLCEQNPGACEEDFATRFWHFSFLWCWNFYLLLYPVNLCPDWTGESIPVWRKDDDDVSYEFMIQRVLSCGLLWLTMVFVVYFGVLEALVGTPREVVDNYSDDRSATVNNPPSDRVYSAADKKTKKSKDKSKIQKDGYKTGAIESMPQQEQHQHIRAWRRTLLTSFCWMMVPFLMSSNIFVYIGLTVADRTLYLPSYGFCLLLIQTFVFLGKVTNKKGTHHTTLSVNNLTTLSEKEVSTIPCAEVISSENLKLEGNKKEVAEHTTKAKISSPKKINTLSSSKATSRQSLFVIIFSFTIMVLSCYINKQRSQTYFWTKATLIWGEGYRVNPNSYMVEREYGLALVNDLRPADAAIVLKKNHARTMKSRWRSKKVSDIAMGNRINDTGGKNSKSDIDTSDDEAKKWIEKDAIKEHMIWLTNMMQNRFILTTAMTNSGNCEEALFFLKKGLDSLDKILFQADDEMKLEEEAISKAKRKSGKSSSLLMPLSRFPPFSVLRTQILTEKAALLVTMSKCSDHLEDMARYAYNAVIARHDHSEVVGHFEKVKHLVENAQKSGIPPSKIKLKWVKKQNEQLASLNFEFVP